MEFAFGAGAGGECAERVHSGKVDGFGGICLQPQCVAVARLTSAGILSKSFESDGGFPEGSFVASLWVTVFIRVDERAHDEGNRTGGHPVRLPARDV